MENLHFLEIAIEKDAVLILEDLLKLTIDFCNADNADNSFFQQQNTKTTPSIKQI